jgi:hypothetical protein
LAELRRRPGPTDFGKPPATLLRQADDQTILALAATLHALYDAQLTPDAVRDWAIVAAPRYLGRLAIASGLQKFYHDVRSVWPLFIPHYSLHAVSAILSMALGSHGPNLGVGGGPGAVADGLAVAASLLDQGEAPAAWLVFSEWNPEPTPDQPNLSVGSALALAILPSFSDQPAGRLAIASRRPLRPSHGFPDQRGAFSRPTRDVRLDDVAQLLVGEGNSQLDIPLDDNAVIRLLRPAESPGYPVACAG